MSFVLGRLALDDPESFPEAVGEAIARVGAAPVPGSRAGLSVSAGLTSFPAAFDDDKTDRQRVRRQLRSLLNNLPMRLQGVYVAWSEDDEQDGWYVPGTATFDVAGQGALVSAFWRFTGVDLALVGRRRTHRRAVAIIHKDRRTSTTPRDYLRLIYSSDFSGLTAVALAWLPSSVTDPIVVSASSHTMSTARTGQGGASLQAIVGASDLAVASFEQSVAVRNLGDVVIHDRRGTLSAPAGGPGATWEEVYGPDWPCSSTADWINGSDIPVIENGLVRVRWSNTNTQGLAWDFWTGGQWVEQGKVLIERIGDTTGLCDTLVRSEVCEWAPDRGVVRAVMKRAADAYSREEVYITLQRGWLGPRVEVYPGRKSTAVNAGAGIHLFRVGAPSGTETANKYDAALQTVTGAPNFSAGTAIGAATFTGQNWIVMRRSGVNALAMAALQAGAGARVEASSSAYGSARNGLSIRHTSAGYVSAHLGLNTRSDTTAIDAAVGTTYDGSRDLGQSVLFDSRTPQTIVSR